MVDVGVGAVAHVIDFRYFLVSLTGVFLALAVGVALGAGPFR
ncbi:MAG: copper transporter, partial [Actinopolymorphaceae bacterium]